MKAASSAPVARRIRTWRATATGVEILLLACALCRPAQAADFEAPLSGDVSRLPDAELERRIEIVEKLLEGSETHADWWQRGWLGVFAGGAVVQGIRAAATDEGDERADATVSAVKAAGGATRLTADPLQARLGADPIRTMPERTRADRLRKLMRAEEMLVENAEDARERRSWTRHLLSAGVNLLGGGILLALDEPERAATSAGVGIAVGELHLWSQPWQPERDVDAYRERLAARRRPSPGGSGRAWRIVPTGGGAELRIDF